MLLPHRGFEVRRESRSSAAFASAGVQESEPSLASLSMIDRVSSIRIRSSTSMVRMIRNTSDGGHASSFSFGSSRSIRRRASRDGLLSSVGETRELKKKYFRIPGCAY
jgi:hypothetical protein